MGHQGHFYDWLHVEVTQVWRKLA